MMTIFHKVGLRLPACATADAPPEIDIDGVPVKGLVGAGLSFDGKNTVVSLSFVADVTAETGAEIEIEDAASETADEWVPIGKTDLYAYERNTRTGETRRVPAK